MAKLILIFLSFSFFSHAEELVRPQSIHEYPEFHLDLTLEKAVPVKGARVAWADFELIKNDFPQLKTLTNAEISNWILTNFAYMGTEQMRLNNIRNTPIPIDNRDSKNAYRPLSWVRSAVMEAISPKDSSVIGMVDIKGFGHGARSDKAFIEDQEDSYIKANGDSQKINTLRTLDHSDGLTSLGEAIAETTRQRAAQMLFDLNDTKLETVQNYAIIHLPVEILKSNGQKIPAGMVLRQAHFGRTQGLRVPKDIYIDDHGGRQKTYSDTAIDFGGVIIKDSRIEKNYRATSADSNPQSSLPWKYGHETAEAFVYRHDTYAIYRHIDEMTQELKDIYASSPNVVSAKLRRKKTAEKVKEMRRAGKSLEEIVSELKSDTAKLKVASKDTLKSDLMGSNSEKRQLALEYLRGPVDTNNLIIELFTESIMNNKQEAVALELLEGLRSQQDWIVDAVVSQTYNKLLEYVTHSVLLRPIALGVLGQISNRDIASKVVKVLPQLTSEDSAALYRGMFYRYQDVPPEYVDYFIKSGTVAAINKIPHVSDPLEQDKLISLAKKSSDIKYRKRLAQIITYLPYDKIKDLVKVGLRSTDSEFFNGALNGLKHFSLSQKEELLIPILSQPIEQKRWFHVAAYLNESKHPVFQKLLQEKLYRKNLVSNNNIAYSVVEGRTDQASLSFLFRLLDFGIQEQRLAAIAKLGQNPSPAVTEKLRSYALGTAKELGTKESQDVLRGLATYYLSLKPESISIDEALILLKKKNEVNEYKNRLLLFITNKTSSENLQAARTLLEDSSWEEGTDLRREVVTFLVKYGSDNDLEAIIDREKITKNDLIPLLLERGQDDVAVKYIAKAIGHGETLTLNLLRGVEDKIGTAALISRLRQSTDLKPEVSFWVHARLNPRRALSCEQIFH